MKNCIYSKIIIIDKDFIGTMILQKLIQKNYNCEVLHFKHYQLAYEYFANTTIQYKFLVFSDIYNIDDDAIDFLMKYESLNRKDTFFILTASIDPNDRLIAAQFNFIAEFIPKPIAWNKLDSILASERL